MEESLELMLQCKYASREEGVEMRGGERNDGRTKQQSAVNDPSKRW